MNRRFLQFAVPTIALLLASICQAQVLVNGKAVNGKLFNTGSTCILGDNTIETGGSANENGGYLWAQRFQASCSTTLTHGYIYSGATGSGYVNICVYSSSASSPQSTDALIGCTGSVSYSSVGWVSGVLSASVTSDNYYWLIAAVSTASGGPLNIQYNNGAGTLYYINSGANTFFTTPPATLTGLTWSNVSWAPFSAYGENN